MKLFELFATLELQTNKFNDDVKKAQGILDRFADKLSDKLKSSVNSTMVAIGNLKAKVVDKTVEAVKSIGRQAMELTGQLEQNVGGSLAVFGTWAETVQEKSAKAFETMGLSAADYLATANQMGSLFKGAGFTTAEAMELTTEAMQRAADVASIMGIDAAWAMESIAGAAKGNFTMMDNLGVAINETTLANYALEKGLKKSTSAMTTQEKVGLAMEMFLERTAEYAGNYAKENDTLAGAMQTAKAAWDNLLSGVEDFSGTDFVDAIENMFRVVTRNVAKIVPRLTSSFTEIAQRAIPKIKTAFTSFWNNDLPGIATQGVNLVINGINQLFGTDIKPVEVIDLPTVEEITDKLKDLWEGVTEATSGLFTWTLGLFTPPDESIDHMGSLSTWWYGTALPFITDTFNWTLGIFKEPEEGVDPNGYIAQWWDNTVLPFLRETCTWTLNMFLPPDENGDITPESVITGWWENVAGSVVAACQWVLGLFSGVADTNEEGDDPKTIIEHWWGTIVDEIIKACEWALGIFQQPVETIDDVKGIVEQWWSGVVNGAVAACEWVLGLFQEPTATEGDAATTVYGWWKDVVVGVVSACKWYLGLFSGVSSNTTSDGKTSTPSSIVLSWWMDTINSIVAVCRWTIGSFFGVANVASDGSMNSPKDVVSAWWNTTKTGIIGLCTWVINSFSEVEEGEGENAPESIVGAWWETAKGAVIAACQWTIGLFSGVSNGTDADGNEITPESIVSTWWGTVVDSIVAACKWTLQLFDIPSETAEKIESFVSSWWETKRPFVEAACQWTLKLFGVPTTSEVSIRALIGAWWATKRHFAESALTWTLKLFNVPTETIDDVKKRVSGWWDTVVGGVQEVCRFVAHLTGFDPPAEGDITTWWDTVKSNIESTIKNLGGIAVTVSKLVFSSDPVIDLKSITGNMSSFAADLTGFSAGIVGSNDLMEIVKTGGLAMGAAALLNSHPIIAGITLLITNWDTLKKLVETTGEALDQFFNKTLPDGWNKLCEGAKQIWNDNVATPVQNAWDGLVGFFTEEIPSGWNTFVNDVKKGWDGITTTINTAISSVKAFFGIQASEGKYVNPTTSVSPFKPSGPGQSAPGMNEDASPIMHKKAVGLNYVPYNEFPALLHEGEAVLTKAEASAWRSKEAIQNVSLDYDRLGSLVAAAVAEAVSGIAIQMDKQTVGTIVSPVIFREMGRQLGNKRFAT